MTDEELFEKIRQNPVLKNRILDLLMIVDNPAGETDSHNIAEERLIESLRGFGNELLHDWVDTRRDKISRQLETTIKGAHKNIKKNSNGDKATVIL